MPVFEQSYRSFDGQVRKRFRWAIVMKQELKVLIREKFFLLVMIVGLLHLITRILQVVAFDIVVQNPNNPLTPALQQIEWIAVNSKMFLDFIRIQGPFVFIATLVAGSGMICNDQNNNLMEIYFSKPLSWRDYAMGKILTLVVIGLTLTAAPALLLAGLHLSFIPTMDSLRDVVGWAPAIVAYSLVIVIPCSLGVLASSSLLSSQNFASISLFMIVVVNSAMAGLLSAMLKENNYLVASFPIALDRVGQELFGDTSLPFTLHWGWAMLFIATVSLGCLYVVMQKARRSEMAQ